MDVYILFSWASVLFLGHMMSVCLTLQETIKLFSGVVLPFCDPMTNVGEFFLLHILINIY